jgi:hypothetical protein
MTQLRYSELTPNWNDEEAERRDQLNEHLAAWAGDGWEMIHYQTVARTDETTHHFIWRRGSKTKEEEAAGIPID